MQESRQKTGGFYASTSEVTTYGIVQTTLICGCVMTSGLERLLDDGERLEVLNYMRKFAKKSFTPVNENTLQAFISTN